MVQRLIFPIGLLIFATITQAEPWLSNRFAQNCAACHAPGRLNKPPAGRRCTLSCQGCHVNPAGGGLRNLYGKWNEERWLRSFQSETFSTKYRPAPHDKQPYVVENPDPRKPNAEAQAPQQPKKFNKNESRQSQRLKKRKEEQGIPGALANVAPSSPNKDYGEDPNRWSDDFLVDRDPDYDEKYYNNHQYNDWRRVGTPREFMRRIPNGDPYEQERSETLTAGGDFRYMYANFDQDEKVTNSNKKIKVNFPMALDLGVRIRPVPEKFSLIVETRHQSSKINSTDFDYMFNSVKTRSAYAMFDDLAYNSFFQYGLYRPMFGHYNPDHTNLSASLSGLGKDVIFKALGFGTAPNVPFATVYMISKPATEFNGSNNLSSQQKGYVVNLGLRGVTLGLSGTLSYWNTKQESSTIPGQELERKMIALTGGMAYKRFIINGESLRYEFEEFNTAKSQLFLNAGNLYNIETKTRLWRENYLVLNYAIANTAPDRSFGDSSESAIGFKSFLLPGTELELLSVNRQWKKKDIDSNATTENASYSGYQIQAHMYF